MGRSKHVVRPLAKAAESPGLIDAEFRARKAAELRRDGWTYDDIAEACGFPDACSAGNAIRARLASVRKETNEHLQEIQQIEGERLDWLWKKVANKISGGNTESGTIGAAIKIIERKAKLWGLDKPVKHEHDIQFGMSRLEADNSSDHKVAVMLLQKCALYLGENPIDIAREAILALGDAAPAGMLPSVATQTVVDTVLVEDEDAEEI